MYICRGINHLIVLHMRQYEVTSRIAVYEMEELPVEDRELVEAACRVTESSYAPYSHFHVGAAARLSDGTIFVGSNQEAAAFPSGMCAERTTLYAALALLLYGAKGVHVLQSVKSLLPIYFVADCMK